MRTSAKQITFFITFVISASVYGIDTSQHEKTCSEIGFKKRTEAHANCVLELLSRGGPSKSNVKSAVSDHPDDATCKSYGFKPGSTAFGECRQKLDFAKQQAAQKQREYEEQKRQYDAQLEEQKRRRQAAAGLALMQMGSGIASGTYNSPLAPPRPPAPSSETIIMPGGRIVNCHTTGSVTNCF